MSLILRGPLALAIGLALSAAFTPGVSAASGAQQGTSTLASWAQFHNTSDHLGVQTSETALSASNVNQLAVGWSKMTGGPITGSPVVANGVVYFGSSDHSVYAVNATTGATVWTHATGGEANGTPAVVGTVVYETSFDGILYALDANTGATLWTYNVGIAIKSSPVVANGVVYFSSIGNGGPLYGTLWAISTSTHTVKWSTKSPTPWSNTYATPVVANNIVYQGWENDDFTAYDATTGALKWTAVMGGSVQGSATVSGGKVYVGGTDGYLYAFDAATGALSWKSLTAPLSSTAAVKSTPAVSGGLVYVDTAETTPMAGHEYAFNATTGAMVWSAQMADYASSSPAVANGVVYAGSFSHQLYAWNASSGAPLWNSGFSAMAGGIPSSPAVANGYVYVGSLDGAMYAFTDTPGAPTSSFISITDSGFSPNPVNNHTIGNGAKWTNNGTKSHTVTDSSGAGIFDSGAIAPGGTYTFVFVGAGVYQYKDTLSTITGTVKAPMILSPASGNATTTFTIQWAGGAAPAGFVFDIQIKRPGSTSWQNWKTGQTVASATFVPDTGTGTYQFRARVKNASNLKACQYSTAKSITVN